jgi:hypothetical protein
MKEPNDLIKERLKKLIVVPFHFESQGAQIIFYEPQAHDRDGILPSESEIFFKPERERETVYLQPEPTEPGSF